MPPPEPPLDATIRVITPENIAFEYRLAGPFRRLPAMILDTCFCIAIIIAICIAAALALGFASPGLAMFVILVSWFGLRWFYGVAFETFMNGQTPGKYIVGLRVLTDSGQP